MSGISLLLLSFPNPEDRQFLGDDDNRIVWGGRTVSCTTSAGFTLIEFISRCAYYRHFGGGGSAPIRKSRYKKPRKYRFALV